MGQVSEVERGLEHRAGEKSASGNGLNNEIDDYWGRPGSADATKFAKVVNDNLERMDADKNGLVLKSELNDFIADPTVVGEAKSAARLLRDNYALFSGLGESMDIDSSSLFSKSLTAKDMQYFGFAVTAAHEPHHALKTALMVAAGAAAFGVVLGTAGYLLPLLAVGGGVTSLAVETVAASSLMTGGVLGGAGYFAGRNAEKQADQLRSLNYFDLKAR